MFSFSSLLSLLILWTEGGGGGGSVHGEHIVFGGVIIEWVWRFTQHTSLVVILADNVLDMSSLHCLFLNEVFIKVQEALVSFALLFMAID